MSLTQVGHRPGSANDPGTLNTIGGLGGVLSNARQVRGGYQHCLGGGQGLECLYVCRSSLLISQCTSDWWTAMAVPWPLGWTTVFRPWPHTTPHQFPFPGVLCSEGFTPLVRARKFSTQINMGPAARTRVAIPIATHPIKPPASPGIVGARLRRRKFCRETF